HRHGCVQPNALSLNRGTNGCLLDRIPHAEAVATEQRLCRTRSRGISATLNTPCRAFATTPFIMRLKRDNRGLRRCCSEDPGFCAH
ncbi:MAG TPA: hypothetical protein VJ180_12500, partial [Pyrinomonadaceae bacterium]|nr:hypothetical protein [Pyrinomonadaceae bacterium]